jgi:hypothetical protein
VAEAESAHGWRPESGPRAKVKSTYVKSVRLIHPKGKRFRAATFGQQFFRIDAEAVENDMADAFST